MTDEGTSQEYAKGYAHGYEDGKAEWSHSHLLEPPIRMTEIARLRAIEEAARALCHGKSPVSPEWWQAEAALRAALGSER